MDWDVCMDSHAADTWYLAKDHCFNNFVSSVGKVSNIIFIYRSNA
jgi:hypothetical protein